MWWMVVTLILVHVDIETSMKIQQIIYTHEFITTMFLDLTETVGGKTINPQGFPRTRAQSQGSPEPEPRAKRIRQAPQPSHAWERHQKRDPDAASDGRWWEHLTMLNESQVTSARCSQRPCRSLIRDHGFCTEPQMLLIRTHRRVYSSRGCSFHWFKGRDAASCLSCVDGKSTLWYSNVAMEMGNRIFNCQPVSS